MGVDTTQDLAKREVASPREKRVVWAGAERARARTTGGAFATVSTSAGNWTTETIPIGGVAMQLARAGDGPPLLVLHHDIGTLERLPFYDALARRFTRAGAARTRATTAPSGPTGCAACATSRWSISGCSPSCRLARRPSLVGLGFGGWIAAEMATHGAARPSAGWCWSAPWASSRREGDILDQALVSYIDYARAGFHDQQRVRPRLRRRAVDRPARAVGHLTAR